MPADKTRKTRQSANDIKVPRPPNAWILFRSHISKELREAHNNGTIPPQQSEVSTTISQMWKNLNVEQRRHWERKAEEEAHKHKRLHPNYKYQPQKKEDKERERELKKFERAQARREQDAAKQRAAKGKGRRTLAGPRCVPSNAPPVQALPFPVQYRVPGYTPDATDADFASFSPHGPSPPASAASSPEPDRDWPDASFHSVSPPSSGPAFTPLSTPYHTPRVESDTSSSSSISPITYQPPHGHPLPPVAPAPAPAPVYLPPQSIQPIAAHPQRAPTAPPHTPISANPSFEQQMPGATSQQGQQEYEYQQLQRLQQGIQQQQQEHQPTPAVQPSPPPGWQSQQQFDLPPLQMSTSQPQWQQHQTMQDGWQPHAGAESDWQTGMLAGPAANGATDSQGDAQPSQSSEEPTQDFLTFDIPNIHGEWPAGEDPSAQEFAQRLTQRDGEHGTSSGLRVEGTDHPDMYFVNPENWNLDVDNFDGNAIIPLLNPAMLASGIDFSFGFPDSLPGTIPETTPSTSFPTTPNQFPEYEYQPEAGPSSRPMSTLHNEQHATYGHQQPSSSGSDFMYSDYRPGDEFINYDAGEGQSSRPIPAHTLSAPVVPQVSAASPAPAYTPPTGAHQAGARRVGGAWRRPYPAVEQEAATPSCGVPAN
ncbi:hypothetical protein BD626DRAFT_533301 [Schizophyllum amplum]|uniref:HMG box domain-containing protein n=1 Tax=Schizophyllum amplum TaxID=97359 RepID=A0A550CY77_9AGAR|nr:hypothetical protein BD626DRAFT_533301 [Auriculariopsis ampla]